MYIKHVLSHPYAHIDTKNKNIISLLFDIINNSCL